LLHYHVKHKTLKSAFALSVLDDKAVNSTIKFFKHLNKHITLLAHLLPCPACTSHESTKLRNCTAFNRVQLIAQLMESVFAPAYGPKEDILSSGSLSVMRASPTQKFNTASTMSSFRRLCRACVDAHLHSTSSRRHDRGKAWCVPSRTPAGCCRQEALSSPCSSPALQKMRSQQ